MLSHTKTAFIVPATEKRAARDMAGGYGFLAGENLILPPLDFLNIAAVIEKNGGTARIFDFSHPSLFDGDPFGILTEEPFGVYIFSVSMPTLPGDFDFIRKAIGAIKEKYPHGNFHIYAYTQVPVEAVHRAVLDETPVEACLTGEIEASITDIILKNRGNGMVFKSSDGTLSRTPPAFVEDLDSIPPPARKLVDHHKYIYDLLGPPGVATMQTSRGCPFPCGYFCPYPAVQGKKWRAKSPGKVLEEIEDILSLGINRILFRDAVFTLNRERTVEICRGIIERKWNLSWWCEARANNLDEELLALMKKAGLKGINIGVETGDEAVLKDTAKPGVVTDDFRRLLETARKIGVHFHFLLIVGIPGENRKSLFRTFQLIRELKPETMNVDYITPYPGTPFYEEALSKNWIRDKNLENYDGHTPVMATDQLTQEEMEFARRMMVGTHLAEKNPTPMNRLRMIYYYGKFRLFVMGLLNSPELGVENRE